MAVDSSVKLMAARNVHTGAASVSHMEEASVAHRLRAARAHRPVDFVTVTVAANAALHPNVSKLLAKVDFASDTAKLRH